jgi:hypothetical protein
MHKATELGSLVIEHGAWPLKVRIRLFRERQGDTPAHRNSVQAGRNGAMAITSIVSEFLGN